MNRKHGKRNYHHNRKQSNFSHKSEFKHHLQLSEKDVGITEFISKEFEGFSGIIKARFSDFQVNEINLEGEVAKLTDTSYPKEFSTAKVKIDFKNVEQSPSSYLAQDKWDAIKKLAETEGEPEKECIRLEADDLSKEARTELHECMKKYFGRKLVISTVNVENEGKTVKYIEFKKYVKGDRFDDREEWPSGLGEYVHFLLYKEKADTIDVCFKLSNAMKMHPSVFKYAGVKDRRGITTQWFCVHKVNPCKLLTRTRSIKNIRIGNFAYKDTELKLGDLQGNKFRIALRNISASDEAIEKVMTYLKEKGFINYYGLQRFGNSKEVPTYEIGVKLLQGKWKEAVDLILKPKSSDDSSAYNGDVAEAKKIYATTGDAKKAFEEFSNSKNKCVESKLLEGLMNSNPNDYQNALEKVPRNMRLLYMHSLQSLIWNRMVSKRIQLFGFKPVEGDLVLADDSKEICLDLDAGIDITDDKNNETDTVDNESNKRQEVKVLSESDTDNYTIYDIVLPSPGYDVVYPENLKEHYKQALEEIGLSLEMHKQKNKTYTLSGHYRKMLCSLLDLTWRTVLYNNPTDDLIRSDFEEILGKPEPVSVEDGKYKALLIEVSLKPSTYATMILREILKMDTSSSTHAKLNDYHDSKQERIVTKSENGVVEESPPIASLLADPEKFKAFQNSIFSGVSEKRKHDESDTTCKKAKTDIDNTSNKT